MPKPAAYDRSRRDFLKNSALGAGSAVLIAQSALAGSMEACIAAGKASPSEIILDNLKKLEHIYGGFPIDQLSHALQTATLARRAGESPEVVVASLCHDMAKTISSFNHEEMAAEMLKPYVSDPVYNMLKHHGIFQGRFYWDKIFRDAKLYLKYKNEPWYELAMRFTEAYDKPAFKKHGTPDSLDSFVPLIRQVVGA